MAAVEWPVTMAQNGERNLHPFFVAGHSQSASKDQPEVSGQLITTIGHSGEERTQDTDASEARSAEGQNGKKRRTQQSKRTTDAQRGFMAAFTGKNQDTHMEETVLEEGGHATASLETDPNHERRKRRKTPSLSIEPEPNGTSPRLSPEHQNEAMNSGLSFDAGPAKADSKIAEPTNENAHQPLKSNTTTGGGPEGSVEQKTPTSSQIAPASDISGPPRKMLRLNASGKFGSPISKNDQEHSQTRSETSTRRRKTKRQTKSLVVVISYGSKFSPSNGIGLQIDNILQGKGVQPTTKAPVHVVVEAPRKASPPRQTHPFFLGSAAKPGPLDPSADVEVSITPRKRATTTTATPGKLRAQALKEREAKSREGFSSVLLRGSTNKGFFKHAGAKDAAWPWKEISHVRPLDSASKSSESPVPGLRFSHSRKWKTSASRISAEEALFGNFIDNVSCTEPCRATLRKPRRLLISGEELQGLVRTQLTNVESPQTEPGQSIYKLIHEQLTSYDLFMCETQSWTQKYAPQKAEQLLGNGREVLALQSWLEALTVHSTTVGRPKAEDVEQKQRQKQRHKQKKKRARDDDLDDFIVSEDDLGTFDEIPGTAENLTFSSETKGSVIRGARKDAKLANVVVISGPSGCGKTAAVYAIAKELGFQVFELNAGSRRSGRDIMDRVGDMAENHIVQREVARQLSMSNNSQAADIPLNTIAEDSDAGRQSTMATFFKPQTSAVPKNAKIKNMGRPVAKQNAPKKSQKQSLILFEEVDILFEEDQGFWATVRALAMHSRRPIILTCTNEQQVRLEEEYLHAILRFSAPATHLATDHMLLIGAAEGHLLQRQAVESLYESKGRDLRASITELNFWCQMSVGDERGGLEWLFQRWPPGSDFDDRGRRLRVTSEDTYRRGMGWLPRELLLAMPEPWHDICKEIGDNWGLTPEVTSPSPVVEASPEAVQMPTLMQWHRHLDNRSAADVFCSGVFASALEKDFHTGLDASQPPISGKLLRSFTEDYTLLQTDATPDHSGFRFALATHIASSATPSKEIADYEDHLLNAILTSIPTGQQTTARVDVITPLVPLINAQNSSLQTSGAPLITCIDRPASIVAADVAPYVRSIVAYDMRLEAERARLEGIFAGPARGKLRKTRAARSALEGGRRETTRRENWFVGPATLDPAAVMQTGGEAWAGVGNAEDVEHESELLSGREGEAGITEEVEMADVPD